jgi:hypothetical protein
MLVGHHAGALAFDLPLQYDHCHGTYTKNNPANQFSPRARTGIDLWHVAVGGMTRIGIYPGCEILSGLDPEYLTLLCFSVPFSRCEAEEYRLTEILGSQAECDDLKSLNS